MVSVGCVIRLNCSERFSTMEVPTPAVRRRSLRLLWLAIFDGSFCGYHTIATAVFPRSGILKSSYSRSKYPDATTTGRVRRKDTHCTQTHVQPDAFVLDNPMGW